MHMRLLVSVFYAHPRPCFPRTVIPTSLGVLSLEHRSQTLLGVALPGVNPGLIALGSTLRDAVSELQSGSPLTHRILETMLFAQPPLSGKIVSV